MQHLKFKTTPSGSSFSEEVKREVGDYFKKNNISQFANKEMLWKLYFWISFWIVSWGATIYFKDFFMVAFCIGIMHMFSHLMIAFNIAHDANHFALFKSRKANNFFSYFMEALGCSKKMWVIAHNQEHHSFINIQKYDNNIDGYKLLRLTPEDKWYKHHKYQWLYATAIYGFATLNYITFRDVKMIIKYVKEGKVKLSTRFLSEFILFKLAYYSYIFIIPIFVFNVSFGLIISWFLAGHFINGIFLVYVFLTGHLTEETSYPQVENSSVSNNWAVHVIQTTGDYAPKSSAFGWLIGNLNFHVAHHLFPKICHVHYKKISPIIKEVAIKHGYGYREIPTFYDALKSHFVLLKSLGLK
ncbi:MAG: acyl-CoA desaturase [Ginsengibacter sp.]